MVRLRSPSISSSLSSSSLNLGVEDLRAEGLSEVEGLIVERLTWTKHSEAKMRFYHLSKQRVQRVLHSPKRIESGIAPNTVAMMQVAGSEKHPYEIWIMVQSSAELRGIKRGTTRKIKIISAWKYPGRTKSGEPLPEEILREIQLVT